MTSRFINYVIRLCRLAQIVEKNSLLVNEFVVKITFTVESVISVSMVRGQQDDDVL